MRSVRYVVVETGPGGPRCWAAGVGRRLPVVRPVPLRVASALAQEGVPTIVRQASRPPGGTGARSSSSLPRSPDRAPVPAARS